MFLSGKKHAEIALTLKQTRKEYNQWKHFFPHCLKTWVTRTHNPCFSKYIFLNVLHRFGLVKEEIIHSFLWINFKLYRRRSIQIVELIS